jgi:hypothetical protein
MTPFRAPTELVIVCTHNRCEILGKALDSLAASTLANSVEREVLIGGYNSNGQAPAQTFGERPAPRVVH